jgi:Tol biopolymer transport system component
MTRTAPNRSAGACLLWLAATLFSADPDPRILFERARMLADRNQQLNEAIQLYGQVVKLARKQQALAAEAQYNQGLLYERLGKKSEAERAFQAVLHDFPSTRSATLARAKLPSGAATETRARRIWYAPASELDSDVSPSPDGRLLSFMDSRTGGLAVHDVVTGESRQLVNGNEQAGTAVYSVFSPDGKRLAYSWFPKAGDSEIRLIALRASQPATLHRAPAGQATHVRDWSRDGKYILAEQYLRALNSMVLVSAQDGTSRILPVKNCVSGLKVFSKDSRYIAYETASSPDQRRNIFTISTTGDRIAPIVQDPAADDALLGWSPDGTRIVFSSNRSGVRDIWSVTVSDGRAVSAPERVLSATDISDPAALTRDGTLYYTRSSDQSEVYVADVNLKTEALVSQPRQISPTYAGNKWWPVWSPDSRSVAYHIGGAPKIVIAQPDSGQEREFKPPLTSLIRILQWHADGRLRIHGQTADGPEGYYAMNPDPAAAPALLASGFIDRPIFSSDGRTMYWGRGPRDPGIFAQDLPTGETKTLYRPSAPPATRNPSTALSPDGRLLAIVLRNTSSEVNSLAVLAASGGEPKTVVSEKDCCGGGSLNWTPDSQKVLYARQGSGVWIVSKDGGTPKKIGLENAGPAVKLSPDGKHVAFMVSTPGEEVWVLENFLPRQ